jgi:hypothetical protein
VLPGRSAIHEIGAFARTDLAAHHMIAQGDVFQYFDLFKFILSKGNFFSHFYHFLRANMLLGVAPQRCVI